MIVFLPNYCNALKKNGLYSLSNSGWQIFIKSFNTKSGLATPNS